MKIVLEFKENTPQEVFQTWAGRLLYKIILNPTVISWEFI